MRLTAQTSCFDMSIAPYVSTKCVSVWLCILETWSFSPGIWIGIHVIHCGKNKFISLPVKFHADRSKFQFCTTITRSKLIINFTRTVLTSLCFFFSKSSCRNNAKYAFQYTFKDKTTKYAKRKKKKRKNTVRTFTTIFAVGYPSGC